MCLTTAFPPSDGARIDDAMMRAMARHTSYAALGAAARRFLLHVALGTGSLLAVLLFALTSAPPLWMAIVWLHVFVVGTWALQRNVRSAILIAGALRILEAGDAA